MKKHTKKTTLINFILDKSGSMEIISNDVIGGFNRYLKDLQKRDEKVLFTLTVFDTFHKRICTALDIKKVEPLSEKNYSPTGSTALYDAAVDSIEAIAEEVKKMEIKPAVLTVVMTDGEENASAKHDQGCFRELVGKLEKEDWTFVYLGANQDSWANASQSGLTRGNVADWASSAVGVRSAFSDLSLNSVAYVASASAGDNMQVKNFMSLAIDKKIK